ncbi:bifunctional response regulator/alkaline phosphatase family protein [bacterium]|nr:bifunctional response regulator/alkaline phosphatase family protein [bacterium]MBU1652107.1 bifunctional response regulator/alkaline phosphatase family protein [bacterium]MBU1881050.1 bifunctional response regulator/alkaline phosphatase family protein [bacterium]
MDRKKVLWADDEIELLRPHILFLQDKGYEITAVTSGEDAIAQVRRGTFDVVLLDEHMSGKDGIETFAEIKTLHPGVATAMITKSDEEGLMEEAIGSQIDDFLIKPVNPSQVLLVLKKLTESTQINRNRISKEYLSQFNQISTQIAMGAHWEDWIDIHVKLSGWDLEMERYPDLGLADVLQDQKSQLNLEFGRFIEENYRDWLSGNDRPPLSVDIASKYLATPLKQGKQVLFLVLDCLRLDQYLAIEPLLYEHFEITRDYHYSILPTSTPYSRNAIFSGLFPSDLERQYPELWKRGEDDESSSNRFEHQFLDQQLTKLGVNLKSGSKYVKVLDPEEAERVEKKVSSYLNQPLVSMVFNFVDILAHSGSDSDVIKEMVRSDAGYRSVTRSWFEHSTLFNIMRTFAKQDVIIVLTTDHGSIRVNKNTKVISDKEASTNLRYKYGRNLKCDSKHAMVMQNPENYKLPRRGINIDYIVAKEDYYFVYPTNYNKYVNLYKNSFQHGGISMDEMILPVVTLLPK